MRTRVKTLLGVIAALALSLAIYASCWHRPAWDRAGGMIGWSQAAIEAKLGAPTQVFEHDIPEPYAPTPVSGVFRTLVFTGFDGHFVARFRAEPQGYVCFRSSWVEKPIYY